MGRYRGLTLRVLGGATPAMGPGKAELIERIAQTGSISSAARAMRMSYRRAWQLVEAINDSFAGPLVVTETGGKRGGGATVTKVGREVLRRFRKMEAKASDAIAADIESFASLLKAPRRGAKD